MSDGSRFNYPNDAHEINPGNYLVTDRNNDRALIVNKDGKISRIIFFNQFWLLVSNLVVLYILAKIYNS